MQINYYGRFVKPRFNFNIVILPKIFQNKIFQNKVFQNKVFQNKILQNSVIEERGSLMPLTFGFFLISLLIIFILVDFSSVMLRQRVLIQENELALMRSSHQLSRSRYYLFGLDQNLSNSEFKVPINCSDAKSAYLDEVDLINSNKYSSDSTGNNFLGNIEVIQFQCDGYKVVGEVSATYVLPLQANALGMTSFTVRASGSATNQYNR